jgi:uncharacterized protein
MVAQKLSEGVENSDKTGESLGIILAPTSANNVSAETKRPIPIGQYVTFQIESEQSVLGVVESSQISSRALQMERVTNIYEAEESVMVSSENIRDKSYKVRIKILGLMKELQKCKIALPEYAPSPGTRIYSAASDELQPLFAPHQPNWLRVGTLLRQHDVEVRTNITKIPSRHLAVLAMTGMGKSNLVSLIAKGVSEIPGSVVIFDYHGEYGGLKLSNIINVQARINPRLLSIEQFADLLEVRGTADLQRTVLSKCFTEDVRSKTEDEFWEALTNALELEAGGKSTHKHAAIRLKDKIEEAHRRLGEILQPSAYDPLDSLRALRTNVINLEELSDKAANVAVAFYLESILNDRKSAKPAASSTRKHKAKNNAPHKIVFESPVVCILEEAHVFLPKDEHTDTKYFASKIARERGKKIRSRFGRCLTETASY